MSTPESLVGQCERCGGVLEFKIAQIGQTGRCYHCGLETPLHPSVLFEPETIVPRSSGLDAKRVNAILISIAVIAVLWNIVFLASVIFPGIGEWLTNCLNMIIR